MTERDDPLWNPDIGGDEELQRLRHLLAPYGSGARDRPMPAHILPRPRRRRRWLAPFAVAACLALMLAAGHHYRLAWAPGARWPVTQTAEGGRATRWLDPGEDMATGDGETARIAVARIGSIVLSPQSRLRLLRTARGAHHVALDHGHLRARIWAPPGFFRVRAGTADVVDLGCDFDLWRAADGSGRVRVRGGWISYRVGTEDILVPEGHALAFAGKVAGTPMREDAPEALAAAVRVLEAALRASADDGAVARAAERVAALARDHDRFTLLSLMTRWPRLADSALYPRLAAMLGQPADDAGHRAAWASADTRAMNRWWDRLPRQPKQWWGGWRDLL